MHFTTDQEDSTTIFRLKEPRLDSHNAGQLKAEFLILAQPDVDTLIVDLTEVRHVDSAGLSALLLAQRQMKSHDGDIRLVGVNDDVRSLLAVTQLDRIFPIFDTVDSALDAEPSLGDDEDEDWLREEQDHKPLGPGAPSTHDIKAGAIAAGGSFGAAALAEIMMTPYDEEEKNLNALALGDDEGYDDEDDDLDDDLDDDFEDDEDLTEDAEDEDGDEEEEDAEEVDEDDVLEDDDFEDDDWDEEELEEDEEEDY